VRRLKQKTRKVPIAGKDGVVEEIIEREIELYDRGGADFDRILDRTEGKPKQSVDMNANVLLGTPEDRAACAAEALERLKAILQPNKN